MPLQEYERWSRASGQSPNTSTIRFYQLRRFARDIDRAPLEVTLDDMITHLQARDWGNGTRRAARAALRSFYGWMHASGRRPDNPAQGLPPVQVSRGVPRPAPDAALLQALAVADPRTRLLVRLAAEAGLRCCEIATIHSDDLAGDRAHYTLRVRGKGDRVRVMPISDSLHRALTDQGNGWVFPGLIEGHISAAYVSKLISRALPGYTAHTLRHRYATRALVGSGGNLRVVQELLGHATIMTTQIYTQVQPDQLRSAALYAA
jgi:site-specific recombinase XerD